MRKLITVALSAVLLSLAAPASAMPKIFDNGKACGGHGNPKLRELPQQARAGEANKPPWCLNPPG